MYSNSCRACPRLFAPERTLPLCAVAWSVSSFVSSRSLYFVYSPHKTSSFKLGSLLTHTYIIHIIYCIFSGIQTGFQCAYIQHFDAWLIYL